MEDLSGREEGIRCRGKEKALTRKSIGASGGDIEEGRLKRFGGRVLPHACEKSYRAGRIIRCREELQRRLDTKKSPFFYGNRRLAKVSSRKLEQRLGPSLHAEDSATEGVWDISKGSARGKLSQKGVFRGSRRCI